MGLKKQAGSALRMSRMDEDCIGSQDPQQTEALENKNNNNLIMSHVLVLEIPQQNKRSVYLSIFLMAI